MSNKTIFKLNASGLKTSSCDHRIWLTMIDGYKSERSAAKMVYGVAVHKYIDTMFKTGGHIGKAREAAIAAFNKPKYEDKKSAHYMDQNHMLATAYDIWEFWITKDKDMDTVVLPDGQPATEVSFSIGSYYEDEFIRVDLEGTIDRIGKIKNGVYVINDFKTTSSWDMRQYLAGYAMSSQMRYYVLALKLMSIAKPESALGQIGKTEVRYCIDGIFIKPRPSENVCVRSEVFPANDIQQVRDSLDDYIQRLSSITQRFLKTGRKPLRTGLFNGSCEGKWQLCPYSIACKAQDESVAEVLLQRDFIQKPYDPLHHQEEV